ncbi:unnamed protein product [Ixodes pacificus]
MQERKKGVLTVIHTARGHLKRHRRLRRRWRATTTRSRSCPNSQHTHAHTTTCNADDDENGAGRRQRRRLPSLRHDQTRKSRDAREGNRRAAAFPVRLFLPNPRTWR